MTKSTYIALALAATALLACDPAQPEDDQTRAAAAPSADAIASQEVADPAVADPTVAPETGSLEARIMALQPQKTRAQWLRFTDPVIQEPGAHVVLLARLDAGTDSPEVRAAVAEAIGRTGADYAAEVAARIPAETDVRVRELLVGTLGRRADTPAAHPGLLAGLSDGDASVRAVAARVLAERSDGAEFGGQLIALLADGEASVRADAARTLGVLKVEGAAESLRVGLDDADAKVRLDSLRALDRVDPARAQLELERLAQDEDPRVARLANQLQ